MTQIAYLSRQPAVRQLILLHTMAAEASSLEDHNELARIYEALEMHAGKW